MFTRKQYLDGTCTHRQFWGQFVTDSIKATVVDRIGLSMLLASTDEHLNDINLSRWDAMPSTRSLADGLKAAGDYLTLSGIVCTYKEAARQIIEETHAQESKAVNS